MAYITVNNYSKLGKMGISKETLASICYQAVSSIPGVVIQNPNEPRQIKSPFDLFFLSEPIKVTTRGDGLVQIAITVDIQNALKVSEICLKIQQEVTQAISMMCETVPVSVQVKVKKVG